MVKCSLGTTLLLLLLLLLFRLLVVLLTLLFRLLAVLPMLLLLWLYCLRRSGAVGRERHGGSPNLNPMLRIAAKQPTNNTIAGDRCK